MTVFHHSFEAMGTRCSLVLPGVDADAGSRLAEEAEGSLRRCERLLSRFDPQSPVAELNARAALEEVVPPPALWDLLVLCRSFWERTRGAFDVSLLPLTELWRECRAAGTSPTAEALRAARARSGFAQVVLDPESRGVRFAREGVRLDFGAFGKGWALDRLAERLRREGIREGFISFGESSVTVLGLHPAGRPWPVGIADLFRADRSVHVFELADASISTSGTAPFHHRAGDRALGHVVDPRDGRVVEGHRTLTVASRSAAEAEVLSTALLVSAPAERAAILARFAAGSAIEIRYESSATGAPVPRVAWRHPPAPDHGVEPSRARRQPASVGR